MTPGDSIVLWLHWTLTTSLIARGRGRSILLIWLWSIFLPPICAIVALLADGALGFRAPIEAVPVHWLILPPALCSLLLLALPAVGIEVTSPRRPGSGLGLSDAKR